MNFNVGDQVELVTDSSFSGVIVKMNDDETFIVQFTDKKTYKPVERIYNRNLLKLKQKPSGFSFEVTR